MQYPKLQTIHIWVPNLFEFKGGIQVYLQDVLNAIEKHASDYRIVVIDKLDCTKPLHQFQSSQFSFLFSGKIPSPLKTVHFIGQTIRAFTSRRPNLIICGHLNFSPVILWIHHFLGISYWVFVYGIDAWNITNPQKINALKYADKIISISKYTRDRLVQEQRGLSGKIAVLPVTFDASHFSIRPKPDYLLKRYHLQPNQPIVLTVARLADSQRFKGYDQILHALPIMRQTIPDIHYVIVGKGSDRPRIERLIAELGVQNCVTLTGFVPDEELCDHYNLCDLFAMPSKREGFGIVYLEALACGKPTLGSNQDGAVDALCQGKLGALVDPDDIPAIAQTMIQILQGNYPNLLMYQPQHLRQAVIDTYGTEQFQRHLTELIQTWEAQQSFDHIHSSQL